MYDFMKTFEAEWENLPPLPWGLRWTWPMVKNIAAHFYALGYFYDKDVNAPGRPFPAPNTKSNGLRYHEMKVTEAWRREFKG